MTVALWIWTVTLAIVTLVIVPVAIVLLHRTLTAASAIERYTREAVEAGMGIAENTKAVAALEETIAAAGALLETSERLQESSAEIAKVVSAGKE